MTSYIIEAFFLGLALAGDAFSVSLTNGMVLGKMNIKAAFKIAFFFGTFQFLMPILGYFVANMFYNIICSFDHWVAFLLLLFIGGKMIYESFFSSEEEKASKNPLCVKTLFLLAIATSIDALAAGVTFATTKAPFFTSSVIIGVVTFILSFIGVITGNRLKDLLSAKAQILGGIILIFLAFKTLLGDLFF